MSAKVCDIPVFEAGKHGGLNKYSVLCDVACCYITNIFLTLFMRVSLKVGGESVQTWLSRMCRDKY